MEEIGRKCKKCLIREIAGQEKTYESIRRLIEDMEPEQRANDEKCESRLGICKTCDYLLEGMCRACGCYVELRAAAEDQECPYGKWT